MANKYLDYDGLVEVASKLKETIDGKQDALKYYSEDTSKLDASISGPQTVEFSALSSKGESSNIDMSSSEIDIYHQLSSSSSRDGYLTLTSTAILGGNTVDLKATTEATYNGSEIATIDDIDNLSSSFESIVANKQDALHFYSETAANANIGANGIYIDAGTAGITMTHGDTELFVGGNGTEGVDKAGVYYNGSEVATVDDISGKLDALKYYSEGSGASIALSSGTSSVGDSILLQTNGPNRPIQIETLGSSSSIALSANNGMVTMYGQYIDFNTSSVGEVRYNGDEVGTVNTNHMWICPSGLTPNTVSNLYPQIGSPSIGDFILWITLNSSNVNIDPLLITSVESDGTVAYTSQRSTWSRL